MENRFDRTQLILGERAMERLKNARVAVFGVGGVGGYVCEALVRNGVGKFDLIDNDTVSISNINRQIIATTRTIGRYKVDVMKERMSDINPDVSVRVHKCFFLPENAHEFDFNQYDYVVDAVDTVTAKLVIIQKAKECNVPVISSMGTGNKLDSTRFKIVDIYETRICPLARVMRRELRKRGIDSLKVVFSDEEPIRPADKSPIEKLEKTIDVPGSTAFVPAAAGLILAGEVVKDLVADEKLSGKGEMGVETHLMPQLEEKYLALTEYLKKLGSVAVAFSAGVDSTFLLYAARQALGDNVVAITAMSKVMPRREQEEARELCRELGVRWLEYDFDVLKVDNFIQNPTDRCLYCKRELLAAVKELAHDNNLEYVIEGTNVDDKEDYRPGYAAIAELDIRSPLLECGFTKSDIRNISKAFGIRTYNKPSSACLASRFAYGEMIDEHRLEMTDKAEQYLMDMGFTLFRVRMHGKLARIELMPEEFVQILDEGIREKIYAQFREIGFEYTTLDIKGYRTGSMNEMLMY